MTTTAACATPITQGKLRGQPATGTPAGYRRHNRAGEHPCAACSAAWSAQRSRWDRYATSSEIPVTIDRLPYAPFAEFLAKRADTAAEQARLLDLDRHHLWRVGRRGSLTFTSAENYCDRLGIHPTEIWGDYYDRVLGLEVVS